MLTQRQEEILKFIHQRISDGQLSPTQEEIAAAVKLRSKSQVNAIIDALVERGFLRRLPRRARALEVIRLPESFRRNQIKGRAESLAVEPGSNSDRSAEESPDLAGKHVMVHIPFWDAQARVSWADWLKAPSRIIPCPSYLLNRHGPKAARGLRDPDHVAFVMPDSTMAGEGFRLGDVVVIQRHVEAASGEIVLALPHNSRPVVRKLERRGTSLGLISTDQGMPAQVYGADAITIDGKVVGLLRAY
ncbi:LexA family protein [Microvirga tunisiensis]|uniref:LexA repressor DNA-binding domain-containing protein n=1 Tax=Microvirga tunisiensis TaxID=2108360 RepID=A0A5N7MP51_9HYPH|nr:S24 family peptidase [Microvirga tunisiensis]MPR09223.1 hypothetical protein [Microvirga tunisiensis]MPR28792.1 hypothetical protein [Microvirga tunisiensis]